MEIAAIARKRGLSDPCEIYQRGAEKLDDILDWCAGLPVPAVTLWVFSTESLKRSQAEVSGILSAIEAKVAALAHDPFVQQDAFGYGLSADSTSCRSRSLQQFVPPRQRLRKIIRWH
jgi:undecaprenyl pyrophosphate synthase